MADKKQGANRHPAKAAKPQRKPVDGEDGITGTGYEKRLRLWTELARLKAATKPVLEVNPHHSLIKALASLGDDDHSFKQDVAHCCWPEVPGSLKQARSDPIFRMLELSSSRLG